MRCSACFQRGGCDERKGHAVVSLIDAQGVTFNFNVYSRAAYRLQVYTGAVILSSFTLPKPEINRLTQSSCLSAGLAL